MLYIFKDGILLRQNIEYSGRYNMEYVQAYLKVQNIDLTGLKNNIDKGG